MVKLVPYPKPTLRELTKAALMRPRECGRRFVGVYLPTAPDAQCSVFSMSSARHPHPEVRVYASNDGPGLAEAMELAIAHERARGERLRAAGLPPPRWTDPED